MRIITNCLRAALVASLFGALPGAAQGQSWQWATASVHSNASNLTITATALDGAGNTVVAGYFSGVVSVGNFTLTSVGATDIFVGRLNSAGTWTQAASAGGSTGAAYIQAMILDNAGNAIVTGNFLGPSLSIGGTTLTNAGPATSSDAFVARLSTAGTWTQALRTGGASSEVPTALALDAAGNIIVGGTFYGPTTTFGTTVLTNASPVSQYSSSGDIFIARLGSAGSWTQAIGAGGTNDDALNALAVDANGTVSAVGYFTSPTMAFGSTTLTNVSYLGSSTTAFVARLNSAGAWTQAKANTTGSPTPTEVAVDANGNAVVAGFFYGRTTDFGSFTLTNASPTGTSGDVFVARLSTAGTWTQAASAGGTSDDRNADLALDAGGNAYLTGYFSSPTAAFGATTLTNSNPATGADARSEIYVARLSAAGTWTNAVRAGGPQSESPAAIAVSRTGSTAVVAGSFTNTAEFGQFTLLSPVPSTAYVAQLAGLPLGTQRQAQALVGLAPNPAHSRAYLSVPAEATARPVLVFDGLGREVRRQTVPARATTATLNVAGLTPGLYVVRYGAATGRLVVE